MLKYIPNIISSLRILLAFLFIPAFLGQNFLLSLIIFAVAAVSDFLDGYIARKLRISSQLGAMLDPVADKILMLISYLIFAYKDIIPYYIAFIVILRDLLILSCVIICLIKRINLKFTPLMSSKINTAVQLAFIILVLTCKVFKINLSLDIFALLVCITTIYSGLEYTVRYRWIKNELCTK